MGATISLALLVWFAWSLLEYRLGKKSPAFHAILINPWFAVPLAFAQGALITSSLGAGMGIGIIAGELLGLATNEFTYALFSWCSRTHSHVKHVSAITKAKTSEVKVFYANNKKACDEAWLTFKMGLATIGAIIGFIIMVFGIPGRLYKAYKAWRGGGAYEVA